MYQTTLKSWRIEGGKGEGGLSTRLIQNINSYSVEERHGQHLGNRLYMNFNLLMSMSFEVTNLKKPPAGFLIK